MGFRNTGRSRRIQVSGIEVFYGTQRASPRLGHQLEQRIRAIAQENAWTFSETVAEALRCYVIFYDKPLEPKR